MSLIERARDELDVFAQVIGYPLSRAQAAALALETRLTVIVAPRQTGKSYALSVLALWSAFRRPGQRVLIVSAGEEASRRLLATIRTIAATALLKGSIVDESLSLLLLTNGSEVRSVPSSDRQIRGWSTDLAIADEAALISDELLEGALFPTTAARPDARIVLASSPWATQGFFYRQATSGLDGSDFVRTFRWALADAPWITTSVIEHARATMSPLRFAAEYLGEFVGSSDAYFAAEDLLAATADYRLLPPTKADGEPVTVGLDWGRAFDAHAIALVGLLEDFAVNREPVLFVPWVETSRRPYSEQVDVIAGLAKPTDARPRMPRFLDVERPITALPNGWTMYANPGVYALAQAVKGVSRSGYRLVRVLSEQNGVGAAPTEELKARLRGVTVDGVHSSQRSKEDAYGRVRALLAAHRLVLPNDPEVLRQLRGMAVEATQSGGISIAASNPAVHDDVADALSLAVAALPASNFLTARPGARPKDEPEWLTTPAGVKVPRDPRPRHNALNDGRRLVVSY